MRYRLVNKDCVVCGTSFQTYSGKSKTCSTKCRNMLLLSIKPLCKDCEKSPRVIGKSYCKSCWNKRHRITYHKNKTCPDAKRLTPEERRKYKKEKDARYREKYKDRLNERQRRYYRTHYEIHVRGVEKRRALKLGCETSLTTNQWNIIKAIYGYRCAYCHKKPKLLTKDHITPLSKGGGHTANNIVPACMPCNRRKHTASPPNFQPILTWIWD